MRPAPLRPAAAAVAAPVQPQRYLTNDEAAEYLRLSPRTLEKQRVIGGGPKFRSSAAASCTRCPTSMPGPTSAATRPRPTRNMPSVTRATTVMAADRRLAGGHRHVQPIAAAGQRSQQREQLDLFRALPGDMAPRDSQDLMAFPFFSLAKSRRVAPIDFRAGGVTIRVEGTQEHGIATIWDADLLIWAASQIVEARDAGLHPSRWIRTTPYEILRFIGRGTSLNDYQRLKAALDRLQSTTVATSIRETTGRRLHRFSWVNEWRAGRRQRHTARHRTDPAGLVLCGRARRRPGADHRPRVFPAQRRHRAVAIPPGAQARRAAGARLAIRLPAPVPQVGQRGALPDFAYDLRALVARQSLPGYVLGIARMPDDGTELLTFRPVPPTARDNCGKTCGRPRAIRSTGYRAIRSTTLVLSGVRKRRKANNGAGFRPSNLPNYKSLTFSRSAPFRWITAKRHSQADFPAGRAAP